MDHPEQLVTTIDVAPGQGGRFDDGRRMSLTALHVLQLASGRRVVLLDDRGWSAGGPPDVWARVSLEEIAETTRAVVGPDGTPPGHSHEQMVVHHRAELAATAARAGVDVEASTLAALPHRVQISRAVRARVARSTG